MNEFRAIQIFWEADKQPKTLLAQTSMPRDWQSGWAIIGLIKPYETFHLDFFFFYENDLTSITEFNSDKIQTKKPRNQKKKKTPL